MEVTSVTKKQQRLHEAAAAVFVITQEDIRRSGVTSIPEALRMVPGLQVARIDTNTWAISSRGFNGQIANKLLVLMDGRSVYSPTYSGVYWDVQDTLLDDIERIEVIRGPGATLWGANAVNGVINIITKSANETKGGLIKLGAGNEEKGFAGLRYGTELNKSTHGRLYVKHFVRDASKNLLDGMDWGDDWEALRGGFRLDGNLSERDDWTLQGDVYDNQKKQNVGQIVQDPTLYDLSGIDPSLPPGTFIPTTASGITDTLETSGWNLLGRWNHVFDSQSSTSLQIYFDHTERDEYVLKQDHDILDIDFQHNLSLSERQDLIWGLGYRHIEEDFYNTYSVSIVPDNSSQNLYSAFIQDQIELAPDRLFLTFGSKFEHNEYTGYEIQPSLRGLWKIDATSSLWAAVSRAVKTPSRIENNARLIAIGGLITTGNPFVPAVPVVTTIYGNEAVTSEKLLAYELGYRLQPWENLSVDLTTYYNDYRNLVTYEPIDQTTIFVDNKMSGQATGLELALDWHPTQWWRIQASYTHINLSMELDADSHDSFNSEKISEDSSPEHQFSLRSSMDLPKDWELDFWVYYVDEVRTASIGAVLADITIDNYTSSNIRLGWRPYKDIEISLVGMNLQGGHTEFVSQYLNGVTEVERSMYAQVRWDF